jgi:hypothetical protein
MVPIAFLKMLNPHETWVYRAVELRAVRKMSADKHCIYLNSLVRSSNQNYQELRHLNNLVLGIWDFNQVAFTCHIRYGRSIVKK